MMVGISTAGPAETALLAPLAIVFRVRFGVLAHLLDLIFAQTAAGGDGDLLLFPRAQVLGADM